MAEIYQEPPLAAEEDGPCQPAFQGCQRLMGRDGRPGAVDQAAAPGALRPDNIVEGQAEPAAVADNLQPLQRVPPEVDAAMKNRLKLRHPDGLAQEARRVDGIAGNGRPAAGGAENERLIPVEDGGRRPVIQIPEQDAGGWLQVRCPVKELHGRTCEAPPGVEQPHKGRPDVMASNMYDKAHGATPFLRGGCGSTVGNFHRAPISEFPKGRESRLSCRYLHGSIITMDKKCARFLHKRPII